ncbi:MAG: phospholipase D-like domain-containing protein [Helicobacteraceae bacterium]|nr:phospholipase D-like domain-containing protein [Helicobacteraceae bacterium]
MRLIIALFLSFSIMSADRIFYVMPKEGSRAEAAVIREIEGAKETITIAMYSFTNNNIAKALKDAAKRGVSIRIVVDDKSVKSDPKNSKAGVLAKIRGIAVYRITGNKAKNGNYNGIMHLKVGVIDAKTSIYGSANWTASAFNINYEILFIEHDQTSAKELLKVMEPIFARAETF